jgi:hypothetical protein
MLKRPPSATLPSPQINAASVTTNTPILSIPPKTVLSRILLSSNIHKLIRKNVMQHNSLYGRVNKNYSKDTNLPTHPLCPSLQSPPKTAKLAALHLPTLDTDTNIPTSHDANFTDTDHHPIPTSVDDSPSDNPTIDTQHFDVPIPTANNGTTTYLTTPTVDDHDQSDLLFDPLQ